MGDRVGILHHSDVFELFVAATTFKENPGVSMTLTTPYFSKIDSEKDFMSEKLKELDSAENFPAEIQDGVVLVDFFASWCRPCRMQVPILNNIAEKLGDKVRVLKVDTDKFGAIAQQFNVSSIPTLIVFKNGQAVEQFTGLQQENTLVGVLGNHAATV